MTSIKQTSVNPVHNSIQQNASNKNSISGATASNSISQRTSQRQTGHIQTQSGATASNSISQRTSQRQVGNVQTQSGATASNSISQRTSQRQTGHIQTQSGATVSSPISQRQTGNVQIQQDTFSQQTSHKLSNSSQFKSATQLDTPQNQTGINIRGQVSKTSSSISNSPINSGVDLHDGLIGHPEIINITNASDLIQLENDNPILSRVKIENIDINTLILPRSEYVGGIDIKTISGYDLFISIRNKLEASNDILNTPHEEDVRNFAENNNLDLEWVGEPDQVHTM